jgi:hypothetical protein
LKREAREVQPFNRVSISGAADFEILCGKPEGSCEVECDDNLLEHLATTVEGGELKIHFVNKASTTQALRVWLATEHLSKISGSGAVTGRVEGLDESFTELAMSGSGKLKCNGKVAKLEINGSGSTFFNCRELAAEDVVVNISGSGKANVNAKATLKVAISGSGSVQYIGSPEIEKHISGSGSVKPSE